MVHFTAFAAIVLAFAQVPAVFAAPMDLESKDLVTKDANKDFTVLKCYSSDIHWVDSKQETHYTAPGDHSFKYDWMLTLATCKENYHGSNAMYDHGSGACLGQGSFTIKLARFAANCAVTAKDGFYAVNDDGMTLNGLMVYKGNGQGQGFPDTV